MALRAATFLAIIAFAHGAAVAAADQRSPERSGEAAQSTQPAPSLLAAASGAAGRAGLDTQPAPVPAKRKPAPRVTSCRCGGESAALASTEAASQR